MAGHDLRLALEDEWTDVAAVRVRIVELHLLCLGRKAFDELIVHAVVHIDALDREAHLPGARDSPAQDGARRFIQVRGLRDDHRILATELQHARDETAGAFFCHLASVGHTAGEVHDIHVVDDRCAGLSIAHHVFEDSGELRDFVDGLHDGVDEARRDLTRLHDDGASGEQRRDGVQRRQHERRVPGADDAGDRVRFKQRRERDVGGARGDTGSLCLREEGGRDRAMPQDRSDHHVGRDLGDLTITGIGAVGLDEPWLVGPQLVRPRAHDSDAPLQWQRSPGRLGGAQLSADRSDLVRAKRCNLAVDLAGARVADGKAGRCVHDALQYPRPIPMDQYSWKTAADHAACLCRNH